MVEPRTRSRDLVEAVVRGRQVMSACIFVVGLCWIMSSLLGWTRHPIAMWWIPRHNCHTWSNCTACCSSKCQPCRCCCAGRAWSWCKHCRQQWLHSSSHGLHQASLGHAMHCWATGEGWSTLELHKQVTWTVWNLLSPFKWKESGVFRVDRFWY